MYRCIEKGQHTGGRLILAKIKNIPYFNYGNKGCL
jgi:hypothetical protein